MNQQELRNVLEMHRKWVLGEPGGERADLRSANLSFANLSFADLSFADLRSADLSFANLRSANLSSVKEDFFKRLSLVKNEVAGLYDFLQKGKIDGTLYDGDCACFVGTVKKIRNESFPELFESCGLRQDSDSLTERWFLAIHPGDIPMNHAVAKVTAGWIEEFAKENSIELPKYKIVSSAEAPGVFVD